MIEPTIEEMLEVASPAGGIGRTEMARSLLLTLRTPLNNNQVLSWSEYLETMVRIYYENADTVEVLMAVGVSEVIRQLGSALPLIDSDKELPEISLAATSLTIASVDNTWWTWSEANAFYHMLSGDKIRTLESPALHTQTLDVVVLWYRSQFMLSAFREEQNAKNDNQEPATPPADDGGETTG